ncbi:nicotinamide riboside transporter PnuC [Actinocorallia sp. A-T 12471]|uniref:nicotinamide riboside transporter PnuC n=1 Tax=Actinocorallia sp. A-T 12471 TaxID=3089813 RepID=UPI0029CD2B4B|nr:nicotinamide riboside transporter PnuC [Actinocorallia sp. A-T 12471]MDX6739828.1 nicotinamide riboside transporter PnuC [Actinocorallia sp. A-T 12471]
MVHELVGPLLEPAFTLGGTPTSWGEVLGFLTGVLTVWLVVRQHIANWGVGIVNVLILGLIFLDSGLYADASLQIVYVLLGLYGWWMWLYGGVGRTERLVQRTSAVEWAGLAAGVVAATAVMTWVLVEFTESTVPFWDALTTALSLAATYGQSRKLVESWWLWITVDLIYIPLYAYKGLYLTGALYLVFLGLCVAGLRAWRRDPALRPAAAPA